MSIALTACFLAAAWIIYISARDLPSVDPASLRPVEQTAIYDANGKLVDQLGNRKVLPVKLSQVPPVVKNAFLAAEDVRFYQNNGIDLRSIGRAVWHDLTTLSLSQGASTITQQLAKNAFLTPDRTIKRKVQEVMLGFELAHRYSKDEILEMYLNEIYLGNGAYGIGAASRAYFNKDVSQLTLPEAALLAGLPQAPSAYSPVSHPEAAKQRRDEVLSKMLRYNLITEQQYRQAAAAKIQLNPPPETGKMYPYFVDYVTSRLAQLIGEDAIYRGGLKVYTTLDPQVQLAAETAFANPANFPASVRDANGILQPEGAAVFLDPQTGAIRAMVGGREHTGRQVLNRAYQTYRQPGSSIKPFVAYGPAIENDGLTPDSIVDDSPVSFGNYSPKDDDGTYMGPVTLRTALALSRNVVAVKLLDQVGMSQAVQFARGVGITSLVPDKEGLSMALGGLYKGVTTLEMAGAYGAVANGGMYAKPFVISEVDGQDGSVLYKNKTEIHRAMQPYTAAALTSMMETGVLSGTGTNAQLDGRPAAGKTGTAEHGRDLWFGGFTPQLAGVVWIGYDHPQNMPLQYGGTYPAMIWRQIMLDALAGKPVLHFRDLYPGIYPEAQVPPPVAGTPPPDNSGTQNNQQQPGNNPPAGTPPDNSQPPGNSTPPPGNGQGGGNPPGNQPPAGNQPPGNNNPPGGPGDGSQTVTPPARENHHTHAFKGAEKWVRTAL
ncbi:hypothetical protein A6M21_09035 [Desulfotomaculum copahuensis]|uniref:Penicillin-binding protein 1A n=1 Tax=Desulfotomaculum copahuensis TaxID=1838280 RepID=A0A1B7LF64_9FIRM|nr:hypothetical protein A6M21_09035 [Desulfotomaculum copahuensis]